MKIAGLKLDRNFTDVIVIPRPGDDIVLTVQSVNDDNYDDVESAPIPPMVTMRGETVPKPDPSDRTFSKAKSAYWDRKQAWFLIESLKATEDIEWEEVTADPMTFMKVYDELKVVFSAMEVVVIQNKIIEICGLSMGMIEEATESFLAAQVAADL
jgi:hypothetical protein